MYLKWMTMLAIVSILQVSCTVERVAGNGSQTGNPMIAGKLYEADGITPACNAYVLLRKRNATILPIALMNLSSDTVAAVRTACNGTFTIDSIDTGLFSLEGTDGGNNLAFIDSVSVHTFDSTIVLAPSLLKPAGAIKGRISLSEGGEPRKVFVIIAALDRFTTADSCGAFKFERLAEGSYSIEVLPTLDNYDVVDTSTVHVKSADTTDIGVIEPPFSGIPTIKNITSSYDTLRQWVQLRWKKPDSALVTSFNVYRRVVDPVTAIFTQLNTFPVVDTVFIDSLCEQTRTYEYRVVAVNASAKEGERSKPIQVLIALYDIPPKNFYLVYDTLKQMIVLRWGSPAAATVTGYNVYRRNVNRNETFWTPFTMHPVQDSMFIDSTFNLCPNCGSSDSAGGDSIAGLEPTYEYCAGAIINNVREGVRSVAQSVRISLRAVMPFNVTSSCDTMLQAVRLQWSNPDTVLIKKFNVFRKKSGISGEAFTQLNRMPVGDTAYFDSTGEQNQTYEYCIASMVGNKRAEVKSRMVKMHFAAYFTATDSAFGSQTGELGGPNDIAVSANGDIYLSDQGGGRIQVFDAALRYKRHFGESVLHYPLKVCVDAKGTVFVADYVADHDAYSIVVFDSAGTLVTTIPESTSVSDIDARDSLLYVLNAGRSVSILSYDGAIRKSWQINGQDGCKWMITNNALKLFVSTGAASPDINKVIVFDNLGSAVSSLAFSDFPYALAFDEVRQYLYVVCNDGVHGNVLHVMDGKNTEKARYKIQSDDQHVSIAIQKNGTVVLLLGGDGKILTLKPLFQ